MATIFPDIEKLFVSAIKSGLQASTNPVASSVTVATIKPAADVNPYPAKIVTVRADGGASLERDLTRLERLGINVYASTYGNASELARLVESIVRTVRPSGVKLVETSMSPIRVDTASTTAPEQRYMTFEVTVKAADA
jgi:hypothetical protein